MPVVSHCIAAVRCELMQISLASEKEFPICSLCNLMTQIHACLHHRGFDDVLIASCTVV
jgi:hypothetical protein